jgi:hypothetical protein
VFCFAAKKKKKPCGSRDGILTGLGARQPGNRVRFLAGTSKHSSIQTVHTGLGIRLCPRAKQGQYGKLIITPSVEVNTNVIATYVNTAHNFSLFCGRSPAEIVGSNPTGGMDVCLL